MIAGFEIAVVVVVVKRLKRDPRAMFCLGEVSEGEKHSLIKNNTDPYNSDEVPVVSLSQPAFVDR